MALTDYTTYPEIRAALSVSSTELPDAVLNLTNYATLLIMDLEGLDAAGGVLALFETISALPAGSRTPQQQRFYDITRLFSSYSVAKGLLATLPLFSVQRLTDGKAEFQRATDYLNGLKDEITAMYLGIKYKLLIIYNSITGSTESVVTAISETITLSILATDPVTRST